MDNTSSSSHEGKPIRCKAAVCRKAGEPLVIEEIQVDPPQAYEVRIKILCTSLCHTDVTFWKLDTGPLARFPRILGHEAVGMVESIGEHVDEFQQGDVVLPVFHPHCENVETAYPQRATGLGAAWKVAGVEDGSTVAIFGLGAVGLAVAEGARLRGAAKIIGVDLNPDKFEIGKQFGITDFINPALYGEKKISNVIKEMTDIGVDYSFECIGLAPLMEEAFNSTRPGSGKTVILGMEKNMLPISLGTHDFLLGKSVCGTLFGGLKPKIDIPILVDRYLKKELNLDGLITHELGFEEINKAFDLLEEGKSIRCVLWMDK